MNYQEKKEDIVELQDIIKPLRRWWWLLALATLLAVTSSFFYVRQQPPVYRARATLMVGSQLWKPNPSGGELQLAEALARSYVDIAMRKPLQEATMAALGTDSIPNYTARVVPRTQFLEIIVVDPSPIRAQVFANEFARQLVAMNPNDTGNEERVAFLKDQLNQLQTAILETQDQIKQKQTELAQVYSAREIAKLDEEIQTLQRHLANLRSLYAELYANTTEGAVNTLSIFEEATLPERPIQEFGWPLVALAGAVGFVLAAGAAYFMEYLDNTIEEPEEIERHFGLPVLGSVPRLRKVKIDELLSSNNDDYALLDEAYWGVSTNLLHKFHKHSIFSLLVTSTLPDEGKTLTAIQIAIILARTGRKVVLADMDLRKPQLDQIFGVSNEFGVADVLTNTHIKVENILRPSGIPNLDILTAGQVGPEHIPALLESNNIQHMLKRLREIGIDAVILDSAPVIPVSDSIGLAMFVDAIVYVVKASATNYREIRQGLKQLQAVDANILGVVLNQVGSGEFRTDYKYYSRRLVYPSKQNISASQ